MPDIPRWRALAVRLNAAAVPPDSDNEIECLEQAEIRVSQISQLGTLQTKYLDLRFEYEHLLACQQRGQQWKPITPDAQAMTVVRGYLSGPVFFEDGEGVKIQLGKAEEEYFLVLEKMWDLRWRGLVLKAEHGAAGGQSVFLRNGQVAPGSYRYWWRTA